MGRLVDRFVARERRADALLPAAPFASPEARRALRRSAWGRALAMVGAVALVVVVGWGVGGPTGAVVGLPASVAVVVGTGLWVWAALDLARLERGAAPDDGPSDDGSSDDGPPDAPQVR